MAHSRSEINDAAVSTILHGWNKITANEKDAGEIRVNNLMPLRGSKFDQRLADVNPGIIDKDVRSANFPGNDIDERRDLGFVGDIDLMHEGFNASGAGEMRGFLKLGRVTREQNDISARSGSEPGQSRDQGLYWRP